VRDPDELAKTDISDAALAALRAGGPSDVYLLARRGPVQAKCSPQELKELGHLAGVDLIVDPRDLELDAASEQEMANDREAPKNLELLRGFAERGRTGAPRRIHLRFLVSPVEIVADPPMTGRVTGLTVERNRLVPARSGGAGLSAEGTGEYETLPVGLVVRAVGYRSLPLADLPFDDRNGIIPNRAGRVVDSASGEPIPGLYVAGWVKRGPTGLIGSNKPDGLETAQAMLADRSTVPPAAEPARAAIDTTLAVRGARVVEFTGWQRLDRLEIEPGRPHGRPRVKFGPIAEMLAALDEGS
jgi:ferredoxin/flavodoxin---NADP+ reductase